jgi:electron transfer flavoprotein beta subunit
LNKYVRGSFVHDGMLLLQAELDFSRSTWALNPFCDIALEEALRLRDEKIVENVTVVSVGDNHTPEILLTGLSKGADRAIHIHAERPLRQLQIAKLLHQIVKKEHFDIILFGKQSIDDECGQTGQMLAGLLGCAQAIHASKVEFNQEKGGFIITKETDFGLETVETTMPVVITADLRLNLPRYASLANIIKAKQKEMLTIQADSLGIPLETRIKTIEYSQIDSRRSLTIVDRVEDMMEIIRGQP